MKNVTLIIGALLFSTLFYKQDIGINLLLFNLLTTTVLIVNNKTAFKKRKTIVFCLFYIISGFSIFLYKSNLSIIANSIAFFTLIGHISEYKSSIYINWLNGLYTLSAGYFHHNFNGMEADGKVKIKKNIDYLHWVKIIGIPITVIIIYILLYKNGNPVFNDFISKINFNFINYQWLLLAVLGYYLLYNISSPIQINPITSIDLTTNNILQNKGRFIAENIKKENELGLILIILLNILIVFFLITDISYLISTKDLEANSLSNQVHSGINALIASILIAIVIILYFFRGNLNFYKNNKNLKTVTYIWITLNVILVINCAIKDCQYIHYFGLTYKRIGVLIYLLLASLGLLTTAIKIQQIKNFWYLLRVNTLTAFCILIISGSINWDNYITHYNLNHARSMDFNYLIQLSNNNTYALKNYADQHHLSKTKKLKIERKYKTYVSELKNKTWQEFLYDNLKIK